MPLRYQVAPSIGDPLVQGELLSGVYELRPIHPASKPIIPIVVVNPIRHSRVIVLTNICDLEQDHKARKADEVLATEADDSQQVESDETADTEEPKENVHYVPYVFLVGLVQRDAMLERSDVRSKVLERIEKSQDKRFHYLPAAPVGPDEANLQLPDLYVDFKKALALPTEMLYKAVESGAVGRVAVVPDLYMLDLVQRQHSYLSRVGLPD